MAHLPTARPWSSPITEQKPHIGVLRPSAAEGLGALLRFHQLTTELEDETGGRAFSISNDLPPGEALAGVDMLVVDGPVPDPIGPVSGVEPCPPHQLGAHLRWLAVTMLALRRGLPTVLHEFDFRDPLPAWAEPLFAGVLGGADRVLIVGENTEQRVRRIASHVALERVDHLLSRLRSPGSPEKRDRYWLLDVIPAGVDHGVTVQTIERAAEEQAVGLVRVRAEPLDAPQPDDPRSVTLEDLAPQEAISLVGGAEGVVLADRDLAVAASALGVPTFPSIDLRSGAWADPPEEFVADQLLMHALGRPGLAASEPAQQSPQWRAILHDSAGASRDGSSLDPLLADLPDHLAGEARQARTARFGQVIMRSEVSRAERKARQLQQLLVETRAERATLRGQIQRAQAAREVAGEAMTDYRRRLRRTETRVENLTGTVEQLRAKLEEQTRAAQQAGEALAQLRDEHRTRLERVEAERNQMAARVADAENRYDRLRNRRTVRVALAAAGWWRRLSGKR